MTKNDIYDVSDDFLAAHGKSQPIIKSLGQIRKAVNKNGFRVLREWYPLFKGKNNLTLDEYIDYQLYDDAQHDQASRKRFVSETIIYGLYEKRLDLKWFSATEDKWLMYCYLSSNGLPVPETSAIVSDADRYFGGTAVVSDTAEFIEFVSQSQLPLFLKPVKGIASSGALLLTEINGSEVVLGDSQVMSIDALFEKAFKNTPYLVQPQIQNHEIVSQISDHLATLRFYNFFFDDELHIEHVFLKCAVGNNVADNYWREGNMMANVDVETGTLLSGVSGKGLNLQRFDSIPNRDVRLSDITLPFWQDVLKLNRECAQLFNEIEFSSTDIAITPTGPVVIEVNTGGSFTLPQIATGKGFLTDRVKSFFDI